MNGPAVFLQECPICGRPLEIRKEYQGQKVSCPHCGGRFLALDPDRHPSDVWNQSQLMLQKADQLLETCASYSNAVN